MDVKCLENRVIFKNLAFGSSIWLALLFEKFKDTQSFGKIVLNQIKITEGIQSITPTLFYSVDVNTSIGSAVNHYIHIRM